MHPPPNLSSVSCRQVMSCLQVCSPYTPPLFSIMQIIVITMTKCVIVRQCLSRDISWDIHETSCPWDELPMRWVAHDTSCPWHKSLTLPSKRFILRHSWDESLITQVLQTSPSKMETLLWQQYTGVSPYQLINYTQWSCYSNHSVATFGTAVICGIESRQRALK